MNRGAANFRIHEVRKSTTPLASGEFSNGAFGEITAGGYNSLADARRKLALWRYDYNNVRPHLSTPTEESPKVPK